MQVSHISLNPLLAVGNILFYSLSVRLTCDQITSYNHISQHDFVTWNPQIGEQCTGLWANAYACVGVYLKLATIATSCF